MVELDDVRATNTALVQRQPLVAVFFGGTSGIGHYTLRALATAEANGGKGFRAYIVGRNIKAAEEIIAECRGICPKAQIRFLQTEDISLIQNVDRVCEEIVQMEEKEQQDPRIDYLMLSQGGPIYQPRKGAFEIIDYICISDNFADTKEGIDVTMSLMYYSRMRAITKLLPLLLKSTLPATVVSVFAAGYEQKLFPDDLSLRDLNNYNYSTARSHMIYMHVCFMETLAEQNRGELSLIHIFPGLVLGPGFEKHDLPAWFKVLWRYIFVPFFAPFLTVPPSESGDRMLSLASSRYPPRGATSSQNKEETTVGTDGELGSGAYSLGKNGDTNYNAKSYEKINKDELRQRVWNHTMSAFETIEAGEAFAD
ncbi:hypothetical protein BO79DRAFT_260146 [Aspergillus costaricaensis CBS 115574]|uniref:Uncharacterized protein n=1 Tax=Aspergillus costaricaensis CBS 115574 TaxID=1448317 RepID=A0ACD1HZ55_9EURO|nr:hypothetical protein BO79DRAFT_260146 [Aspergillus costaricaensis CBS 115574]RAK83482.1 hypothetical protein BO79DRAFT_260146 [Aspergillus costaricaensis CBS 115574]